MFQNNFDDILSYSTLIFTTDSTNNEIKEFLFINVS